MTRLGLITRADNRGLGSQGWEVYRHLRPAKTLVVCATPRVSPCRQFPERYGRNSEVVWWDSHDLPDTALAWLVDDVDVIFTAETPYDYRVYDMARARGVRSVLQANPEFYRHEIDSDIPKPDLVVVPTTWRLDLVPGASVLPVPVARDRLPFRRRREAKTFLHIVGRPAAGDRAGTSTVLHAFHRCQTRGIRLVVCSQAPLAHYPWDAIDGVDVEVRVGDVENYWELYEEADVLVAPRRYGGLSLPAQEALSSGMPVLSLDIPPNRDLLPPDCLVRAGLLRHMSVQSGVIDCYDGHEVDMAALIDRLAANPDQVAALSDDADRRADLLSWDRWKSAYEETFASLADGVPV